MKFQIGDLFVVKYIRDPGLPDRHGILTRMYTEFNGQEWLEKEWLEIYWAESNGRSYRGEHDSYYVRMTLMDRRFCWKHYPVKENGNGK